MDCSASLPAVGSKATTLRMLGLGPMFAVWAADIVDRFFSWDRLARPATGRRPRSAALAWAAGSCGPYNVSEIDVYGVALTQ